MVGFQSLVSLVMNSLFYFGECLQGTVLGFPFLGLPLRITLMIHNKIENLEGESCDVSFLGIRL